jgi:hypothetical protein
MHSGRSNENLPMSLTVVLLVSLVAMLLGSPVRQGLAVLAP